MSLSSLNAFHCACTLLKHSKITHSGCCLLPCLELEGLSPSVWCVTCTHFIKSPSAQLSFMSSCLLKPYAEAQRLYSKINGGRLQLGLDLPSGYFLGKTLWTFWLTTKMNYFHTQIKWSKSVPLAAIMVTYPGSYSTRAHILEVITDFPHQNNGIFQLSWANTHTVSVSIR